MTKFNEKLTEIRKNAGETQDMLGSALGVSGKTVSKWESGTCEPDLETITKIAAHYNISTDALLGLDSGGSMPDRITDELMKDETIAGAFRKSFELQAVIAQAMHRVLNRLTEGKMNPFEFPTPYADAVPGCGTTRGNIERQMMHSDFGCLYAVFNDDINLSVGLYRNKNDFAWLKNNADALAALFGVFADPDALRVLYYLERADYPRDFTAEYTAKQVGITPKKAEKILDSLVSITANDQFGIWCSEIELAEGVRKAYTFVGNGMLLALCTVAENIRTGININSGWNGFCKLIGEPITKGEA